MAASEKIFAVIPRIVDTILLGVLKTLRFLVRFVPPRVLSVAADYIGHAIFHIRRGAREYLLTTLREALPDVKDEGELRRIAKEVFATLLKSLMDMVLMERYGDRIMENLVVEEGTYTRYDEAEAAGKGLILFSPHLGAAGIINSVSARLGRVLTPLVIPPKSTIIPRFLTAVTKLGASLGCDPENPAFWTGTKTIPKVQEHLRKGKSVGITFDMLGGTVVDFLGQPTAIASGIAHFACDSGAPILSYYLKRGRKPLHYQMIYFGEVTYELTGDRSKDVRAILESVVSRGEMMIRDAPGQWDIWFGLRHWRERARQILSETEKT